LCTKLQISVIELEISARGNGIDARILHQL